MNRICLINKPTVLLLCFILTFSLIGIVTSYEQRTGWAWHKKYASDHELLVFHVEQTHDGGYILGGVTTPYKGGAFEGAFIIKTDGIGNLQWNKQFDDKTLYNLRSVRESSDGGYFLATWYYPSDQLSYSITKTDANGNFKWILKMDEEASNVLPTTDGGCIYSTPTHFTPQIGYEAEVGKIDQNGVIQWNRKYSRQDMFNLRSIILTSDGGLLIGLSAGEKVSLIKTDSIGQEQWSKIYDYVDLFAVQQTSDGGYSLVYRTYDIQYGLRAGYKIGLAKLESNGNVQRTRVVDEPIPDLNPNQPEVQLTPDGGFIFLHLGLYKLDDAGKVEWRWNNFRESADIEQTLQTKKVSREIHGFRQTSDGGYILYGLYEVLSNEKCSGFYCEYLVENGDAWLIKIDKKNNPSPRTETSDRIFLSSGKVLGQPGFDIVISLLGLAIVAIYCKRKYT